MTNPRSEHEDELEPSEDELREAAALAAALEDGRVQDGLPSDAWEAALLLRHVVDKKAHIPDTKLDLDLARRRRRLRMRAVTGVLALAATVLLVFGVTTITSHGGAVLPAPSLGLLASQAKAAGGGRDAGRALEVSMRAHRKVMLGALGERYGDGR